jgi:Na+-driven multidrug efflux pump
MRNVFGFFGVFSWAFASTANSMVSNVIGQGKGEAVVPLLFKINCLSTSLAIVVCLLLNLFPGAYFAAFGQASNFGEQGIPTLRIVSIAIVILSAGSVWLNGVTGTGNSRITFLIEAAAIVVYCIYVFVVLEVMKLSIAWGWASELFYWTTMFSISYWYIRSGRWMRRKAI